MLLAPDRVTALRLRGSLLHKTRPQEAQIFFERSLHLARESGDQLGEMSTLSTYSNLLYPSYFPVFWLDQRPFPHADRLRELTAATGYVPMIQQGDLIRSIDYAAKLQILDYSLIEEQSSVGFLRVFGDAMAIRRMAIDLGDVKGEMEATYVLAVMSLYSASLFGWVPMFSPWIECQRLRLLAEALGSRPQFGEAIHYVWELPPPEGEASVDQLRASMFS